MGTANSRIKYFCGGSSLSVTKNKGSAVKDYFYFKPAYGGRAYLYIVMPIDYQGINSWRVEVTGPDGYGFTKTGAKMSNYMQIIEITGLKTAKTYSIKSYWITDDRELEGVNITRTYYGSNTSPTSNPYSDSQGNTTVPTYRSGYPKFCLEVECPDNASHMDGRCPYDVATRNLFWSVCATNYETHPTGSPMEFQYPTRWPSGTVYVDVKYESGVKSNYADNVAEIEDRIDEWIAWMNGLVEHAGVTFELGSSTANNTRQITVVIGTHKQLWGYDPDGVADVMNYGGTWESMAAGAGIYESRVKICCEDRYPFTYGTPKFEGIVYEELIEASGPRYDQYSLNNTIFSEIAYPGKTVGGPPDESWERDENVIKLLYSLGYLRSVESSTRTSKFGSGIKYTKTYDNFGPMNSKRNEGLVDQSLFFCINATAGSITGDDGYSLPTTIPIVYKSQRDYNLRARYATEVPETEIEKDSGLSFRYTDLSPEGTPYFSLPNPPDYTSSKRINGGYQFGVKGLSNSDENYYIQAYLKDVTDDDTYSGAWHKSASGAYSRSNMSITGLEYGRRYDFYLHSEYNGIQSDWVLIGDGIVAPKVPTLSNESHTDSSVTFTYGMDDTVFDEVVCKLYCNDELIKTYNCYNDSDTVTLNFSKTTGNYVLVYSVVYANGVTIQSVSYNGANVSAAYMFQVSDRAKFYWADHTTEVKAGGKISSIDYTAWNAFVQNIYDTVCVINTKGGDIMPSNTTAYATGFGSAAEMSFATALMTYAMMSDSESGRTLSAERFNIVNYIISSLAPTGVSYKYNKATSPTKIYASDLITLQDKLNSI